MTGKARYLTQKDVDLPGIIPPAVIDGREYFDGGLSNPIPIDKLVLDGNNKALIVLTRPEGFQKECRRSDRLIARAVHHKYPVIARQLCTRYKKYNHSVLRCEKMEKDGSAVIIRPSGPIHSYEKDVAKLRQTYEQGYNMAMARMEYIDRCF